MLRSNPFVANPGRLALANVRRIFCGNEDRQYLLFRAVLRVIKHRPCCRTLGCVPTSPQPYNKTAYRRYRQAFSSCWQLIDKDDRLIVHGQILRYIYAQTVQDRQPYDQWFKKIGVIAKRPDFSFYRLVQLPQLMTQLGFNPIWHSLPENTRHKLMAVWWRIIKRACRIEKDTSAGIIIWKIHLPGDQWPIQISGA